MTAGITAEVASNASNLLMDIKPGYMLGAKPRQQAIGHVLGIFAGAAGRGAGLLPGVPRNGGPDRLVTDQYPDAVGDHLEGGRRAADQGDQQPGSLGPLGGPRRRDPGTRASKASASPRKGRFWLSGVGDRAGHGDPVQQLPDHVPRLALLLARGTLSGAAQGNRSTRPSCASQEPISPASLPAAL